MARIPESVISEILDKADIETVVSKYVTLVRRSGTNRWGLCPFHADTKPSFCVSITKNIYSCFVCHKTGNAISFIMEMEHLTYPEAIRFLGKMVNVEVPEDNYNRQDDGLNDKKKRVMALLTEAARFFYKSLHSEEGKRAIAYMRKREVTSTTATNFGLGYAPEGWDKLYKHLKDLGYTDEEMEVSGLFTRTSKGNLIDLFRGRLMFPIMDEMGKIVAFGGRDLGDGMPKYINSPDSLVYKKQNHLYAMNFAKKERSKQLIIVEGYMDAIAMHQAGVRNTVASLGTAFTDSQLKMCARYAEEVIFFFDSDNAGQMAALRAIKMMLGYLKKMTRLKIDIKIAKVPGGKDPDEYIRMYGADAFRKVVDEAKYVDEYLTQRAYDDNYTEGSGLNMNRYIDDITLYGSLLNNRVNMSRMASTAAFVVKADAQVIFDQMQALADDETTREKMMSKRDIERQKTEDVASRNERLNAARQAEEQYSDMDVPEYVEEEPRDSDHASELELKLLAYALYIGDELTNSDKITTQDILKPVDFESRNMKALCRDFIEAYNDMGHVTAPMMMNILKRYSINGEPAENVFFNVYNVAEQSKNIGVAIDLYLDTLYSIREQYCKRRTSELISMYDHVSKEERKNVETELRKLEHYLEQIKIRRSQL